MWITEFREANGISLQHFGAIMRHRCKRAKLTGEISDGLIERLETEKGFVTHPHFANLIAEACGATALQRDGIVHEKHRGKWKPGGKVASAGEVKRENPWRALPAVPRYRQPEEDRGRFARGNEKELAIRPERESRKTGENARKAVIMVDRDGNVLARYDSVREAAKAGDMTHPAVVARCMGRIKGDEFQRFGYTFRFREKK